MDRFPRERVTLSIQVEEFAAASVVVDPARPTGIEIRLHRLATVRGVVKTAAGAPAAITHFELRRPGARLLRQTVTGPDGEPDAFESYEGSDWPEPDDQGRFEAKVAPGRWNVIWLDDEGKEHQVAEWSLQDGESREFEIVLPDK
jgi:hypothetical protein